MGCSLADGGSAAKEKTTQENTMQLLKVAVKCVVEEYSVCRENTVCAGSREPDNECFPYRVQNNLQYSSGSY